MPYFSRPQETRAALEQYAQLGQLLAKQPDNLRHICDSIMVCRTQGQSVVDAIVHPFILINTSSGQGKTQSAFGLRLPEPTARIVYLLCQGSYYSGQPIYQNFDQLGKYLEAAIYADLAALFPNQKEVPSIRQFEEKYMANPDITFQTAGLIVALCDFLVGAKTVSVTDSSPPASPGTYAGAAQNEEFPGYFRATPSPVELFPLEDEWDELLYPGNSLLLSCFPPSAYIKGDAALIALRTDDPLIYESLTLPQYQERMKKYALWVLVCDEVPAAVNDISRRFVAFIRNMARLSGLVTILMGTNATVADFLTHQGSSASIEPWCYVHTQLHETNLEWIATVRKLIKPEDVFAKLSAFLSSALVELLQTWLQRSRPRVASITYAHLVDIVENEQSPRVGVDESFLRKLIKRVFASVADMKGFPAGSADANSMLRGQLSLLQPFYTERFVRKLVHEDKGHFPKETHTPFWVNESILVCRHFATPVCSDKVVMRDKSGALFALQRDSNEIINWIAVSMFAANDVWLWMVMCAVGQDKFSRWWGEGHVSIPKIFEKCRATVRTDIVVTQNPEATKPQGHFLEAVGCTIAICASQIHGLTHKGIPVDVYVQSVLQHSGFLLGSEALTVSQYLNREVHIAFLLPASIPWEDVHALERVFFLTKLDRPGDGVGVDGKSTSVLVECKDYGENLNGRVLQDILRRLCTADRAHIPLSLVFTQWLQHDYFTGASSQTFSAFFFALPESTRSVLSKTLLLRVVTESSPQSGAAGNSALWLTPATACSIQPLWDLTMPVQELITRVILFIPLRK